MRQIVCAIIFVASAAMAGPPGDPAESLVFFRHRDHLFPLAVGPEPGMLRTMAPGVI